MTNLTNKRILLTGGTSGIGRATLSSLAAAGARMLTCGRHRETLDEAIAAASRNVSVVAVDIATGDGVDTLFAAADHILGGIDMLVACAALGADPVFGIQIS